MRINFITQHKRRHVFAAFYIFSNFFSFYSRALPLSKNDLRGFVRYYATLNQWEDALQFSKNLIQQEELSFEDIKVHAHVLWQGSYGNSNQRDAVLSFLKEHISLRGPNKEWLSLWEEYVNQMVSRESIQHIGFARVELKKGHCPGAWSLLDAVPIADRSSRLYDEALLDIAHVCEVKDRFLQAWTTRLLQDPFCPYVRMILPLSKELLSPVKRLELIHSLEKQWPEQITQEIREQLDIPAPLESE